MVDFAANDHFSVVCDGITEKSVALEDGIFCKGRLAAAGSRILESFTAPFDATVVERLAGAGYTIAGKTKMDEFGLPAFWQTECEALSGAVGSVASGESKYALCNDFAGTIRRQAAQHGLCYIHPTYGSVSRYGLIPAVSSMDAIGVLCRDFNDGFKLLEVIAGHDERDGTSLPQEKYAFSANGGALKYALAAHACKGADEKNRSAVRDFASAVQAEEAGLPYFDCFAQVQYILQCAEVANNISRYDGIKFGFRAENFKGVNELYLATRTEGFGLSAKLAAVIGSMVLSQAHYDKLYHKSMQIRRLIKDAADKLFEQYDVLILPAAYGEGCDAFMQLALYALPVLAGLPAVSIPYSGAGVQLVARRGNENALLKACGEVTV